jgi:hypothetical protein
MVFKRYPNIDVKDGHPLNSPFKRKNLAETLSMLYI